MRPDEYPSFLVLMYTPPSKIGAHRRAQCHESPCQPAGAGLDAYTDEGRDHLNSLLSPHYCDKAGSRRDGTISPLLFSEHMVTVGLGITSPDYFRHSWLGRATLRPMVATSQAHCRLLLPLLSFVHRENRDTALPIQGSGSCKPGC